MKRLSTIFILLLCFLGTNFIKCADDRNEKVIEELIKIGEIYQTKGCYTMAVRFYSQLLQKYPDTFYSPIIKLKIAECYEALGSYEKALRLYNEIKQGYPERGEALLALVSEVRVFNILGKYSDALKSLSEFSIRYPDHPETPLILFMTAETLMREGKLSKAAEVYESIIRKFPASPYAEKSYTKLKEVWGEIGVRQYLREEFKKEKKRAIEQLLWAIWQLFLLNR